MERLNSIVAVLSTFSSIAISLSAIIGLLSLVFKPVRKCVVWIFKKVSGRKTKEEEFLKAIEDLKKSLTEKVDGVETNLLEKIQEVSDRNDENEKDRIRWEILDFANSCANKRKHSREEFEHIIELNEKYKKLLEKTGDSNGVFEISYDYIKDVYTKRLQKNDFLVPTESEEDS